ncbi:MAG: transketolase [Acidimicrobiales bacterium]
MKPLDEAERVRLNERALFVRLETLRLTRIAGAGHYSGTFSAAELLATLYYRELRLNPANASWPDRDRFVLSKGHAAIGLYPILADLGYFDVAELETYTRLGSAFGDHPDMRKVRGIDFSSGSLGHGLSIGVGMALGGRVQERDFHVFVMVGDAELNEGQVWEAAMSAGHFKLASLVCIVDRNQLGIDGRTEDVMSVEPIGERFSSFGWDVQRIDGHNVDEIAAAFDNARDPARVQPHVVIADTVKGKGVQRMELDLNWHVGNLNPEDYEEVYAELLGGGPK